MSVPKGRISFDWEEVMSSEPTPEVEFICSSSPVTRCSPRAARGVRDDGSDGDEGIDPEFADSTDEKLQEYINLWRSKERQPMLAKMPDGGEKMRVRLNRMEKELRCRNLVRQRKDDTVRDQQAKLTSGSSDDPPDPYDFTRVDELSDNMSEKYPISLHFASNTKTHVQVKGMPFSKVQKSFSQDRAYPNKNGRTAKTSAMQQLHPRSAVNMYNDSTVRTRKRPLRSCNRRQNNNTVDSESSWEKLAEDSTFDSDKRWDQSKKKESPYFKFKRDVVHVDIDDDTEAGRLADTEMSDKWDKSKTYYPSSTDSGAVELSYSDMKCLEPEEFLKSPIINFYIQYLKNSRPREDMYMFNTYFYCKLEEALCTMGDNDSQFIKLRRWWKSVDIFKKAYIILPINEIFLEEEWCHLNKVVSYDVPFSRKIWERLPRHIDKKTVPVPRQLNEYDCGLFMLYYIERLIQEAPKRMTREELHMFGYKWFQPKDASGLREGIRALLFELFQNAQEDDGSSMSELQLGDHAEANKDVDTHTIILDDE